MRLISTLHTVRLHSQFNLAHLYATYNMHYMTGTHNIENGIVHTLCQNGVTLTKHAPPVCFSQQPAAPITPPQVRGPLDDWLVPSSVGSVCDFPWPDDEDL